MTKVKKDASTRKRVGIGAMVISWNRLKDVNGECQITHDQRENRQATTRKFSTGAANFKERDVAENNGRHSGENT
jgi:hypothetical protein